MLAKVRSLAVKGIEGCPVQVEVDLAGGLPTYATVGLPDAAVRESRERVVAAVRNSGFDFPIKKVTVNLAPAGVKKEGSQLDLAIAVGILLASEQILPVKTMDSICFLGELALDGSLRPVSGALPMALKAREMGVDLLLVPEGNRKEVGVQGLNVLWASHLREVCDFLSGSKVLSPCESFSLATKAANGDSEPDFCEVKGQRIAKRALEIAAAGGHNVLFVGPPGAGKSMLAQRIPSILPGLSMEEALEITKIYSVSGLLNGQGLVSRRPYRAPHHTISDVALVGGSTHPRPGEISLAHGGVLFLDEIPEFNRNVLEVLRQPLENRAVTISRAKECLSFPASFILVAAMNPCPCGYLGHPEKPCLCTPLQVRKYRSKISGPLLDRVDLQVHLSPVKFNEWAAEGTHGHDCSQSVRRRVELARTLQKDRFQRTEILTNAQMRPREIRKHCRLGSEGMEALEVAMQKLSLSARSLDRILKVARTIADLNGEETISQKHLIEAIQYRSLDRDLVSYQLT
ncbi:MAG: YifB family Mg chelatase-like AAA ATPase [Elusimicrobia bacterium]|nr:YifB family Mg chelatase-like AAA ATPase [Elusimicrobiota bacterium]